MIRRSMPTWRGYLLFVAVLAVVISATRYAIVMSAPQRICVRNLQRLGQACAMYQSDWNGVLVPYGRPFSWQPPDSIWTDLLEPYLRQLHGPVSSEHPWVNVFRCPGSGPDEEWLMNSYGMNQRCGGWRPGKKPIIVRQKDVRYPGATIMIAEVKWLEQGESRVAAKPSEFDPKAAKWGHQFAARHHGKSNVLWIDGHVSSMTQKQYNMQDNGPYDGNIWLRLEGPKPPVP